MPSPAIQAGIKTVIAPNPTFAKKNLFLLYLIIKSNLDITFHTK